MSIRDAFTVVGTIAGAAFGYPQLGYALGSALGSAIDPQVIKGPSLGELAPQTSTEGGPRPIVWALSPPMGGNIIASSEPRTVRKRQRQGKGGPKVESEHVYRTYAIGVCEGPITRFVRIWRNNTLVFDVSEFPAKTHSENIEFMKHARFFLGTWTQNASPALERTFGVGATPSHRGTAYMVMDDEELTDLRGAIPQYLFQVERCEGFFVTSRPYALEAEDALALGGDPRDSIMWMPPEDGMSLSLSALGGELRLTLHTYATDDEGVELGFSVQSGENRNVLLEQDTEPEGLELAFEVRNSVFDLALITYDEQPEALELGFQVSGGTLT